MSVPSLAEAEQRLIDILEEPPSIAERLSQSMATRRTFSGIFAAVLLWLLLNHALGLDPFPYRGLQRVCILVSLTISMLVARANGDRGRRVDRMLDAQRALFEARIASK